MNPLPPSLDRFGTELEHAVRRDLGARRRRLNALRGAALLAAAAAVALGVLSALPTGGPSVVTRAAAALASDDSILHYQMDAEQQNGDGTTATWHSETWQLLVAPYTRRQVEVDPNGLRADSVTSGDTDELYDASNDTIYITTNQELRAARMPEIEIVSKSRLERLTGSTDVSAAYVMRKNGSAAVKVIATKEGAKRVEQELTHQADGSGGEPEDDFRSEILALLNSGSVQVVGHLTVHGRDAIRLESPDGKQIYIVDAATYDPIEWTKTGNGGGVTLRFPMYEKLPVDDESNALLDLEAQHPGAQVVRDVHAYMAAESRLYPHG
jgi:outer membrane lipoprotein-sorting protein